MTRNDIIALANAMLETSEEGVDSGRSFTIFQALSKSSVERAKEEDAGESLMASETLSLDSVCSFGEVSRPYR